MSALRCAARRLVGLRALAAVQAQQRWLLPRLLHSGRAAGVSHPPTGNTKAQEIQKEVRRKKEEMYNLLAQVELKPYYRDSGYDFIDRYHNRKLLQHLCANRP